MANSELLPDVILRRKAVIYVRQSSPYQVVNNLESKRLQYDLVNIARQRGFVDIEVIDDDLGRTAGGTISRPGFERLLGLLCANKVGAVLCLDASRLARNGRDWHHLLELCRVVGARVIDADGVYDPGLPNDRLLLGMKGSISEFELSVLRGRMDDAKRSKASRGELRISVPVGYVWHRDVGLGLDPDLRLQEVIRSVFAQFRSLGSARRVLAWMTADGVHFPRPSEQGRMTSFEWVPIRYGHIIHLLKNPFHAGVYAYGKSETQTTIIDGRARKSRGPSKPFEMWEVMIKDHHEGYIGWEEYERNQKQLAVNNYANAGGVKSGRGGRALLSGIITCGRCGRRLRVAYTGKSSRRSLYKCDHSIPGQKTRCITFSGKRIDAAIAQELLRVVEPVAIEAAFEAQRMHAEQQKDKCRILALELEQARYESRLAERRYAACDPDNRLIAAQLEKNWEQALQRVKDLETRQFTELPQAIGVGPDVFANLANELSTAWNAPKVSMQARQQLLRTLITDIIANVDDKTREVILTIHWRGGQHSELRVSMPWPGQHGRTTPENALEVVRSMAGRWPDEHIAATLNRMGLTTSLGNTWTAARVAGTRRLHGIRAHRSAESDSGWLTMSEAAKALGITHNAIRRLIADGMLPAVQVVPRAPFQIQTDDLALPAVKAAIARNTGPCRVAEQNTLPIFSTT